MLVLGADLRTFGLGRGAAGRGLGVGAGAGLSPCCSEEKGMLRAGAGSAAERVLDLTLAASLRDPSRTAYAYFLQSKASFLGRTCFHWVTVLPC